MEQIKAVLIGAGGRGADTYANYILEHQSDIRLVAVCDPNIERQTRVKKQHKLEQEQCFNSWEELLDQPQLGDVAMICTQDNLHFEPAVKLMEQGYHLLLEKPMSNQLEECIKIVEAAKRYNKKVVVCHVLRYTPFFKQIKTLLHRGSVGKIMNVEHSENVAFWHYAMSYVRGAWAREEDSSPMILAKSCHDLDILNWLIEDECEKVASFGEISYFKKENAPKGAPKRCRDGCPQERTCPWFAPKFFMGNPKFLHQYTDTTEKDLIETKLEKLHQSPYGRCVYHCDNNVVDHQSTILKYKNGVTVTFTMTAFTHDCGRSIRIMGTQGELIGDMVKNEIIVKDYLSGITECYTIKSEEGDIHFGGDSRLMDDFVYCMKHDTIELTTSAKVSLMSHIMAFAAEKARKENKVIDLKEYFASLINTI